DAVWTMADILNALMAIPNIVAIWMLSKVIADDTKHYLGNLDEIDRTEIPVIDKES
ncbi:MAG: alanine:cation symporter family protein, partial [Acutalibacteraceae bacterium]